MTDDTNGRTAPNAGDDAEEAERRPRGARRPGAPRGNRDRRGAPGKSGSGRGPSGRSRGSAPRRDSWQENPVLFGHHAVAFAIANADREIKSLALTENAERKLADTLSNRPIAVERVTPRDLDRRLGADTVHQGVMAEVEPLPEPDLDNLIATAVDKGPIVLLDQVTDPQNVGAVLRSAAVFGAAGVVLTRRQSPPLHGVLAKAASGALELVPICLVPNLARALGDLQAAGVRCIGLAGEAETALHDVDLRGPTALVLGAEGKGLRQSTAEACDQLVRISAPGPIASLNVSNAAAVALHFASLSSAPRA
ncbi:MAG: 23S rRNA (guanosine(2251)-2'-O)-methyltransferase RlmB [Pseudomonadota bacterium]